MKVEVERVKWLPEYIIRIGDVATVYVPEGFQPRRFFAFLKRLRIWTLGELVDMITSKGEKLVPLSSYALKLGDWWLVLNTADRVGADVMLVHKDGSYFRVIAQPSVILPAVLNIVREVVGVERSQNKRTGGGE